MFWGFEADEGVLAKGRDLDEFQGLRFTRSWNPLQIVNVSKILELVVRAFSIEVRASDVAED